MIEGIFSLAGVVLGVILDRFVIWLEGKSRESKQLKARVNRILSSMANDRIYPELSRFKTEWIASRFFNKPTHQWFFDKWLMDHYVDAAGTIANWDDDRRKALFDDLRRLKF